MDDDDRRSSSSIRHDDDMAAAFPPQPPSLPPLLETETTHAQQEAEAECAPFFVDLTRLGQGQLDHLCQVGLLVRRDDDANNDNNNDDDANGDAYTSSSSIQLLRDKHVKYLEQVWQRPLKAPFVSLDSSRPWILYWCLHGYDLLTSSSSSSSSSSSAGNGGESGRSGTKDDDGDDSGNDELKQQKQQQTQTQQTQKQQPLPSPRQRRRLTNRQGCNMVATLKECWQSYHTKSPPKALIMMAAAKAKAKTEGGGGDNIGSTDGDADADKKNDAAGDPFYFTRHRRDVLGGHDDDDDDDDDETAAAAKAEAAPVVEYYCGGFGGGPGQIAHAATTYAAVLALSILATDDDDAADEDDAESDADSDEEEWEDDDDSDGGHGHDGHGVHYSVRAFRLLNDVRIPLYRWMASLQQEVAEDDDHNRNNNAGGYRMHHDGEVDVRATYTVAACAGLLGMLESPRCYLKREAAIAYCISCQTYEGGMGGEPFSEAHGGYTFCGVAALQLMGHLLSPPTPMPTGSSGSGTRHLDVPALVGWLARRQMSYEGGFSGRANKLVDGCYSFWQGGAMAIASSAVAATASTAAGARGSRCGEDVHAACDPWLQQWNSNGGGNTSPAHGDDVGDQHGCLPFPLLYDVTMLERYILLCAQEVSGGLRDKPSKPRDFYHTCYNLSGLSVAQHCSRVTTTTRRPPAAAAAAAVGGEGGTGDTTPPPWEEGYGDAKQTLLAPTHPCYNIRVDRVQKMLNKTWSA